MLKPSDVSARKTGGYRGSALLHSSAKRMLRVLLVVVLMWVLTGWALGW